MKLEEIEKRIGDYLNSKEKTIGDLGLENLLENRIMPEIERNVKTGNKTRSLWWTAAASIIAIISIVSLHIVNQKNIEIARLESDLTKKNIANKNSLLRVIQLQNELEIAMNNVPKTDTIYKTEIVYKPLKISSTFPITSNIDTIGNSDELNPDTADSFDYFIEEIQPDPFQINVLQNFYDVLANRSLSSDSIYDIINFRIDFGEMNSDNSERALKIRMTYL